MKVYVKQEEAKGRPSITVEGYIDGRRGSFFYAREGEVVVDYSTRPHGRYALKEGDMVEVMDEGTPSVPATYKIYPR